MISVLDVEQEVNLDIYRTFRLLVTPSPLALNDSPME